MSDTISRQAAIDVLDNQIEQCDKALGSFDISMRDEYAVKVERASLTAYKEQLEYLPSVQPRKGKWTTEEVAEMLFILFGDECACNYNGIDEWLPERCKYTEIAEECPHPKEKHGCWMQFLLQGGGGLRGEQTG